MNIKIILIRTVKFFFSFFVRLLGVDRVVAWTWNALANDTLVRTTGSYVFTSLKILNQDLPNSDPIRYQNFSMDRNLLVRFFDPQVGKEYGVDAKKKFELIKKISRTLRNVPTATCWQIHVVLAVEVLLLNPTTPGDLVECGVYKGGSSCTLSLLAELTGRKLWVCDSFEGLPEDDLPQTHDYPHLQVYGYYKPGMYEGRIEEVKGHIEKWGSLGACTFLKGFYVNSLVNIEGPFSFIFLDVDLTSSMKDCILNLWPQLVPGGKIFTDDSCDMEVVRLWFDDKWWNENLKQRAPGYVGSGSGLPLFSDFSSLGYVRKNIDENLSDYKKVSWLHYPEEAKV